MPGSMEIEDGVPAFSDGNANAKFCDPYDSRYNSHWEATPLRPFKTKDEYLYAMQEDLTDWLNDLYSLDLSPETFFDRLENGVILCQHGNNVRTFALEYRQKNNLNDNGMDFEVVNIKFKTDAKPGTFLARDNVSNFIHWCRHCLKIKSVLMFETDDLVMRKNDRSFVLCLLEVARRGGQVGMPVPLLVQFEREIDRELNGETLSEAGSLASTDGSRSPTSSTTATDIELESPSEADSESKSVKRRQKTKTKSTIPKRIPVKRSLFSTKEEQNGDADEDDTPHEQIRMSEEILMTLDEMVRELVNRCTCPMQFPMIRENEGRYRIGESSTLIFVRILRNHVMVRVGGGWDTLEHYLDKHDPCQCGGHKKVIRTRSKPKSEGAKKSIYRRSSVDNSNARNKILSPESTGANDSDGSDSVKSLPISDGPTSNRPDTLQLPSKQSPRNSLKSNSNWRSPDESMGSDSLTPTSETSSKYEEEVETLKPPSNKKSGVRSVPGSPKLGQRERPNRLGIPKTQAPLSATEEFRKKRQQARLQSLTNGKTYSAPSSPTRKVSLPNLLSRFTDQYEEFLKRVSGSPAKAAQNKNTLGAKSKLRERSLSPSLRSNGTTLKQRAPRRKTMSDKDDRNDILMVITRDAEGRHRLDSTSSGDSMESAGSKNRDAKSPLSSRGPKIVTKPPSAAKKDVDMATKVISPAKRLIEAQKSRRSLSLGRTGYHSRENSVERTSTIRNVSDNNKLTPSRTPARSRPESNDQNGPVTYNPRTYRRETSDADFLHEEDIFHKPRKPRARKNSFSSEPGDWNLTRKSRNGRTSPTGSVKSTCSVRSTSATRSRLRPVTRVPISLKFDTKTITPIRKEANIGPPSKIPMPVQHKVQLEEQNSQSTSIPTVLAEISSWVRTRSYDKEDAGAESIGHAAPNPTRQVSTVSTSPTPSGKGDHMDDSGYEDNNLGRLTSPLSPLGSLNSP